MKKLILVILFLVNCTLVQASTPGWLNQIKLSGLSGPAGHRLAVINDETFSTGEENDLKLKGKTVHVQCLEIRDQSVLVQIQDLPSPCELTFSGIFLPDEDYPAAAPASTAPAAVAPPAPAPVTPIRLFTPTLLASQPDTGKSFSLGIGWVLTGMVFALLVGIGIGAGSAQCADPAQWQHRKNVGEARLADTIDRHFSRPHLLLNNVTLPTNEGTTQIDHVLLADTGIFVIEAKHYSGWIFGNPSDEQWTQTIYRHKFYPHKSRFQNPLRQNYAHVKTLQSLFDLPEDHFHSVAVFTGEAEFKSDLGPNVIQLSGLIPFLSADRPVVLDERKMTYIVGRIEMKRERRSLETDEYHRNHVRDRIAAKIPRARPQAVFPPSSGVASASGDEKYKPH